VKAVELRKAGSEVVILGSGEMVTFVGRGVVIFVGGGKVVNATAAKHSEKKLKFWGHAAGISSGESTLRTADLCAGRRDWMTRFITSVGEGCVVEELFVPSAHINANVGSNASASEIIGTGVPRPYCGCSIRG
jgi:hypothetical protein